MRAKRPRDPNAPPWRPGPVPAEIPIRIDGMARDEAGSPIAGATIALYAITDNGSKPAGTATTDAGGHYAIPNAMLPLWSSFEGRPFPKESTPYATFIVSGLAPTFEAVGTRPGNPVPDVYFWKAPEEQPEATQQITTSTFRSGAPWTDAKGELRAVVPPEPGRRYRFRFAGIHEPNMPPGINPKMANKHGYLAFPTQSVPVELIAGKTIRLRFILRNTD
jgi:hypothetical protein